jgi:ATP-dependent RNA helicase RhlE
MSKGVDILVATPGRLLDLVQQAAYQLDAVTTFIVDEADRMLDMGFIRDVRKLVAMLPRERQSMLFSATMPDDIVKLTHDMLRSARAHRSRAPGPDRRPRRAKTVFRSGSAEASVASVSF